MPMDVAHLAAAAFALLLLPDPLLPQPASINAPSAVVATIPYAFNGNASPSQDGSLSKAQPQARMRRPAPPAGPLASHASQHEREAPGRSRHLDNRFAAITPGQGCVAVQSPIGLSRPIGGAVAGQLAGAPQISTTPS
jgi:hypothetical protein